ncbi:MAG: hypothetical protein H6718_31435 [Polyangiaceae bacterium]|nr:hypothetical protein [Polyangiaceae bacterium]
MRDGLRGEAPAGFSAVHHHLRQQPPPDLARLEQIAEYSTSQLGQRDVSAIARGAPLANSCSGQPARMMFRKDTNRPGSVQWVSISWRAMRLSTGLRARSTRWPDGSTSQAQSGPISEARMAARAHALHAGRQERL